MNFKFLNKCECKEDSLCGEAKKLWKLKSIKGKNKYSFHRLNALGLLDNQGKATFGVVTIWPNRT